MKPPLFKCRASAAGKIMTNGRGKDTVGQTAITYLQEWSVGKNSGRTKPIDSKYIRKGNAVEQKSLNRVAPIVGELPFKNETFYEDEFFTGTPDFLTSIWIVDVKSAWSEFTMPYFGKPDSGYADQLQIYMHLTGRKRAILAHCLENAPDSEIERAARSIMYNEGLDEVTEDIWNRAKEPLTFDHLPDWMRMKTFHFQYNPERIEEIQDRVKLLRVILEDTVWPELMENKKQWL
jgi:hypothetical protein